MAVTFDDLIIEATDWLDEAGVTGGLAGTGGTFANASAEFKRFVNRAYQWAFQQFWREAPARFQGCKSWTLSWVDGTELYTVDTECLAVKFMEGGWDESDEALRLPIFPVDYSERHNHYGAYDNVVNADAFGQFYVLQDSETYKFGFVPVPGVTKTNNIKYWGFPRFTALALTGDTITPELEEMKQLIGVRAAMMIGTKAQQDMSMLAGELADGLAALRTLMLQQFAGPQTAKQYGTHYDY